MRAIILTETDSDTIAQKASLIDRAEALALFSPKPNYAPRHSAPTNDFAQVSFDSMIYAPKH